MSDPYKPGFYWFRSGASDWTVAEVWLDYSGDSMFYVIGDERVSRVADNVTAFGAQIGPVPS